MSEPNDNGGPTWQDQLFEQSYGSPEEPEVEPQKAPPPEKAQKAQKAQEPQEPPS